MWRNNENCIVDDNKRLEKGFIQTQNLMPNGRTVGFSGAARTTNHFVNDSSRPPLQPMVPRVSCFVCQIEKRLRDVPARRTRHATIAVSSQRSPEGRRTMSTHARGTSKKVSATDERRNLIAFGIVEESVGTNQKDAIERTVPEWSRFGRVGAE